jgi:DNA-binding transcriptional regulator of glucitol operon
MIWLKEWIYLLFLGSWQWHTFPRAVQKSRISLVHFLLQGAMAIQR